MEELFCQRDQKLFHELLNRIRCAISLKDRTRIVGLLNKYSKNIKTDQDINVVIDSLLVLDNTEASQSVLYSCQNKEIAIAWVDVVSENLKFLKYTRFIFGTTFYSTNFLERWKSVVECWKYATTSWFSPYFVHFLPTYDIDLLEDWLKHTNFDVNCFSFDNQSVGKLLKEDKERVVTIVKEVFEQNRIDKFGDRNIHTFVMENRIYLLMSLGAIKAFFNSRPLLLSDCHHIHYPQYLNRMWTGDSLWRHFRPENHYGLWIRYQFALFLDYAIGLYFTEMPPYIVLWIAECLIEEINCTISEAKCIKTLESVRNIHFKNKGMVLS